MDRSAADTVPNIETQPAVPVTAVQRTTVQGTAVQRTAPVSPWQVVGAVVRGVSHERLGLPCQDAQDYRMLPDGTLLVALADGAGSASFSDQGARCAVKEALNSMAASLAGGQPQDIEGWRGLLREVFDTARAAVIWLAATNTVEGAAKEQAPAPEDQAAPIDLAAPEDLAALDSPDGPVNPEDFDTTVDSAEPGDGLASEEQAASGETEELFLPGNEARGESKPPAERAYATTLTCAIVTADRLVVGQIGDGVVVAGEGERLFSVTRLQRGEYANETHFLTQPDALAQMSVEVIEQPVRELAVMSDGLVRLALKMPEQEPFAPFFKPLFRALASIGQPGGAPDGTEAARQLSAFLGSERVNARTDDDKSLVLAVRQESRRESGEQTLHEERTMVEDAMRGSSISQ